LAAQLRLICAQIAKQDTGLSLTHVEAGELLKVLRVVAPITHGDTEFEPARVSAVRLQRQFVDGEAEFVEAPDRPFDPIPIAEPENRLGVQDPPESFVAEENLFGFVDQ